ncbi:hypothetical protein LCGC14_2214480 [marine sediment metagenome]|uniref:Uncharacterized protein n=1 Tax=marine sediment metagenome TaxID=412755 RepID=A0A0F9FQE4_9ZZZZ
MLRREVAARQDERWARVSLLVLWILYVAGILAIAVTEGDLWPGGVIALSVLPVSALVRSHWAIRHWAFLGPRHGR